MKKKLELTKLGELSQYQRITFFIIYLCPIAALFLLHNNPDYQIFMLLIIFLFNLYSISHYWMHKKNKEIPKEYFKFIHLQILLYLFLVLIIIFKDSSALIYPTLIFLLVIILNTTTFLHYLINYIYIRALKKEFPFEKEEKNEVKISKRNLSKYVTLDQQMTYFNLQILNFFVYSLTASFVALLIFKHFVIPFAETADTFMQWILKQENISLFNTVSLVSLSIAVYSVTIPRQLKIMKSAEEEYRKERDIL